MARKRKAASAPTPARGSNLTLSVGLVNVAVKLAPLTRETSIRGKYLCPQHEVPVKNSRVCSEDGHVVDDPVLAFEHDGHYVTGVDRGEHKSDRDGTIELVSVVDLHHDLDPLYFEKAYLLWPQPGSEAAHDLIAAALRASDMALIGQTVLSTSTRALAIRWSPVTETLVAHQLTFDAAIQWQNADLVRDGLAERGDPADAQLALAQQLLASLPAEYDLAALNDDYNDSLRDAIAAAAAGKPIAKPKAQKPAEPVGDLMAALAASVEQIGKPKPKAKPKQRTSKPKAKAA